MTCRDVADFLGDYLSEELPHSVRADFEYHLSRCSNCRTFIRQYRETIAAGRRAFGDAEAETIVPPDLVEAIIASIPR